MSEQPEQPFVAVPRDVLERAIQAMVFRKDLLASMRELQKCMEVGQ